MRSPTIRSSAKTGQSCELPTGTIVPALVPGGGESARRVGQLQLVHPDHRPQLRPRDRPIAGDQREQVGVVAALDHEGLHDPRGRDAEQCRQPRSGCSPPGRSRISIARPRADAASRTRAVGSGALMRTGYPRRRAPRVGGALRSSRCGAGALRIRRRARAAGRRRPRARRRPAASAMRRRARRPRRRPRG